MADITVGTIIEKFEKISEKKKRVGLLLLAVATFAALLVVFIYLYINRDLSYLICPDSFGHHAKRVKSFN
uniref:hypothetical protein n=1 Tax=Shewanella indica TaxID=768528 RepID=UPI003007CCDB